ncbi:membrane-spanning 4-domains subfamily A member 12-like isoform X3 [Notamacropus eugenii]|uniref:membrane-spanning 4-domains subfamily A member 12-like isoform X3 n=1 Tax=Notamacropus eugenii TaxID=9315 RepID=UPI003B670B0E
MDGQESFLQMSRGLSWRWTDSVEVYDYILLQEESRILGTLQINIGIFHLLLGGLWYYIQITQFAGTDPNYKTFILNAKYPLISAVINVMSGTLAIITEKKRLRSLGKITVGINVIGIIYSIYGLITLIIEFLSYNPESMERNWPERSGKLLSDYLFIYTIFYIFVSWTVLKWNHKAVFYSN